MKIDFLTVHIVEVTAEAGGRFKQTKQAFTQRLAAITFRIVNQQRLGRMWTAAAQHLRASDER